MEAKSLGAVSVGQVLAPTRQVNIPLQTAPGVTKSSNFHNRVLAPPPSLTEQVQLLSCYFRWAVLPPLHPFTSPPPSPWLALKQLFFPESQRSLRCRHSLEDLTSHNSPSFHSWIQHTLPETPVHKSLVREVQMKQTGLSDATRWGHQELPFLQNSVGICTQGCECLGK